MKIENSYRDSIRILIEITRTVIYKKISNDDLDNLNTFFILYEYLVCKFELNKEGEEDSSPS